MAGERLSAAFSADGNRLACLAGMQAVQIWSVSDRIDITPAAWRKLRQPDGRLVGQAEGKFVLAARQDLWLLPEAGAPERSAAAKGVIWVGAAGQGLARRLAVLADGSLRWWGEDRNAAALPEKVVHVSVRGPRLALTSADGNLYTARIDTDDIKPELMGQVPQAAGAAVSEEGLIAVWTAAGELFTNTGGQLAKVEVDGGRRIRQAGWRPGQRMLVAQVPSRELVLIDAQSGRVLRLWLGHDSHVSALAFDRTGRWAASGDDNGEARLWDVKGADTGASTVLASGMNLRVQDILLEDGAAKVACALDDSTVRLVALPEPRTEPDLKVLQGAISSALGVEALPDDGPTAVRNP